MDQLVGERQVGQRVLVDVVTEVVVVAGEDPPQAVVQEEHARDTVEPKAIHSELVHPETAVRKKEVEHLRLGVVEAARIPGRMLAARPFVKVEARGAVLARDAFDLVSDRMRVNEVHEHAQPHAVGLVHQGLELLRCSEA